MPLSKVLRFYHLQRSCSHADHGFFLDRFLINFDVYVCSQVKQDFFDLLSEQHIEGGQRWSKVKERLETDPRYKAVESSALREELYKQYMEKQAKVGAVLYRPERSCEVLVLVDKSITNWTRTWSICSFFLFDIYGLWGCAYELIPAHQ